jgi:hypothetical protein
MSRDSPMAAIVERPPKRKNMPQLPSTARTTRILGVDGQAHRRDVGRGFGAYFGPRRAGRRHRSRGGRREGLCGWGRRRSRRLRRPRLARILCPRRRRPRGEHRRQNPRPHRHVSHHGPPYRSRVAPGTLPDEKSSRTHPRARTLRPANGRRAPMRPILRETFPSLPVLGILRTPQGRGGVEEWSMVAQRAVFALLLSVAGAQRRSKISTSRTRVTRGRRRWTPTVALRWT